MAGEELDEDYFVSRFLVLLVSSFIYTAFNPYEMLHCPNLFLGGAYLITHNSWLQCCAYILLFQNAHHVPRETPFPLILLVYWPN